MNLRFANKTFRDSSSKKDFTCLEVSVLPEYIANIEAIADDINKRLNSHSANRGVLRTHETVKADNLIGLIAEYVCYDILHSTFGDKVIKPASSGSFNQIDILFSDSKSVEVRSSCIRKGIKFALFAVNREGQPFIDVVGPYKNDQYKAGESIKDYYMRVIYEGDISDIIKLIASGNGIQLYITGGVTKEMLDNNGYLKYMNTKGDTSISTSGKYLVIPIKESLDYPSFIQEISNNMN